MSEPRRRHYALDLEWTGNLGEGTRRYDGYARSYRISAPGKPPLDGSADPAFLGDAARWNPEDLLLAALSACHKLWYLHLCANAGVVVTAYRDHATGEMQEGAQGGQFVRVVLAPQVWIADPDRAGSAERLHASAARRCFIRNSVNFPVEHAPTIHAP
jgi:organic hydroperoxide reductase OsmC/OhrA